MQKNRVAIAAIVICATLGYGSRAGAETITATLTDVIPFFQGSTLSLNGSDISDDALGELYWTGSSTNPTPFNSTFQTFCLELADDIGDGGTYGFTLDPDLTTAPKSSAGGPMTAFAAKEMQSLFATAYTTLSTDDDRIAFQLAVWSLVYNQAGQDTITDSADKFYVAGGVATSVLSETDSELAAAYTAALDNTGPFNADVVALLGQEIPGTDDFAQDQITVDGSLNAGNPPFGVPEINASGAGMLMVLLAGGLALRDGKRRRSLQA